MCNAFDNLCKLYLSSFTYEGNNKAVGIREALNLTPIIIKLRMLTYF